MKLNELIEQYGDYEIKDLGAVKAMLERPKTKTVHDLKVGDKYWVLYSRGGVDEIVFKGDTYDKNFIKCGYSFLTEEAAIKQRKHDEIEAELKRLAGGHEFVFGEINPFISSIVRDHWSDPAVIVTKGIYHKNANEIYFESEEAAQKAIEEIGEERLLRDYFNVLEEEE